MQIAFSSLLILLAGATVAWGQPLTTRYTSPETHVAAADHVVIATFDQVVTTTGRDGTATQHAVTLNIKEIIKGDLPKRVTNLKPILGMGLVGWDDRFNEWKQAEKEVLCFISDGDDPDALRSWHFHRLGKPSPAEAGFVQYPLAPTFDQNLAILKTEEEFLARAREYARNPEPILDDQGRVSIQLPYEACHGFGDYYNGVELPIDKSLEKLALRLISNPKQFLKPLKPQQPLNPQQPHPRYRLRLSGIECLRFFKSKSNIALLEKVMDETPTAFAPETYFKPLRLEALETLLDWGAVKTLPKFASSIENLQLSSANMATEKTFELVGKMTNLKRLNLPNSKITASALNKLSNLQNLSFLELHEININDDNVQALRHIDKLHTISAAAIKGDNGRPQTVEEVHSLTLWNCPLTDQGIQQFADFHNVEYLDLRNTKVSAAGLDAISQMGVEYLHLEDTELTDADMKSVAQFKSLRSLGIGGLAVTDQGLQQLTALKQLIHIRIDRTKITAAGIAEFKSALPECKIAEQDPTLTNDN